MLKAEFRCFLIDFVPVLNFHIRVGHVAIAIKKQCDLLLVLIFFWSIKILFKKTCYGQPGTGQPPWGKLPFSEYLWFQSDALLFSICQMLGQTCGTRWWKKKRGLRGRIPRKDSKRISMPAVWKEFSWFLILLPVSICRWQARLGKLSSNRSESEK